MLRKFENFRKTEKGEGHISLTAAEIEELNDFYGLVTGVIDYTGKLIQ